MDPLVMTPSTVTFAPTLENLAVGLVDVITRQIYYSRFPAIWVPFSQDPAIRVMVTNHSVSSPLAPILVDKYPDPGAAGSPNEYSIFAELTTVQPGQTVDETVAGLPVTQMYLVLWILGVSTAEKTVGFTADVQAWRL